MTIEYEEVSVKRFVPFAVKVTINDTDELIAFTRAIGKLCNGHGLDLYPFLKQKLKDCGHDDCE